MTDSKKLWTLLLSGQMVARFKTEREAENHKKEMVRAGYKASRMTIEPPGGGGSGSLKLQKGQKVTLKGISGYRDGDYQVWMGADSKAKNYLLIRLGKKGKGAGKPLSHFNPENQATLPIDSSRLQKLIDRGLVKLHEDALLDEANVKTFGKLPVGSVFIWAGKSAQEMSVYKHDGPWGKTDKNKAYPVGPSRAGKAYVPVPTSHQVQMMPHAMLERYRKYIQDFRWIWGKHQEDTMSDYADFVVEMSQGGHVGRLRELGEDSPLEAPTSGFNRHSKLMSPATRALVLKSRATEIEAFAEDRGFDAGQVMGVAEAAMRLGKVPDLTQYGFSGDDAKAVKHFVAGEILNIAIEDLDPRKLRDALAADQFLDEARKAGKKAHEIADALMNDQPVIHELRSRFGLSLEQANRVDSVSTHAFGPGGKGYAWAVRQIAKVVKESLDELTEHTVSGGMGPSMKIGSAFLERPSSITQSDGHEWVQEVKDGTPGMSRLYPVNLGPSVPHGVSMDDFVGEGNDLLDKGKLGKKLQGKGKAITSPAEDPPGDFDSASGGTAGSSGKQTSTAATKRVAETAPWREGFIDEGIDTEQFAKDLALKLLKVSKGRFPSDKLIWLSSVIAAFVKKNEHLLKKQAKAGGIDQERLMKALKKFAMGAAEHADTKSKQEHDELLAGLEYLDEVVEDKSRKQRSKENKARFAKMSPDEKAATQGDEPFHPDIDEDWSPEAREAAQKARRGVRGGLERYARKRGMGRRARVAARRRDKSAKGFRQRERAAQALRRESHEPWWSGLDEAKQKLHPSMHKHTDSPKFKAHVGDPKDEKPPYHKGKGLQKDEEARPWRRRPFDEGKKGVKKFRTKGALQIDLAAMQKQIDRLPKPVGAAISAAAKAAKGSTDDIRVPNAQGKALNGYVAKILASGRSSYPWGTVLRGDDHDEVTIETRAGNLSTVDWSPKRLDADWFFDPNPVFVEHAEEHCRPFDLTEATYKVSLDEVSPPGWSGTVKAMKGEGGTKLKKYKDEPGDPDEPKGIDNPWALAWHLHKKGAKPHYKPEPGKPKYRPPEKSEEAPWREGFLGEGAKLAPKLREKLIRAIYNSTSPKQRKGGTKDPHILQMSGKHEASMFSLKDATDEWLLSRARKLGKHHLRDYGKMSQDELSGVLS